jgi:signal transduction histidine kinase
MSPRTSVRAAWAVATFTFLADLCTLPLLWRSSHGSATSGFHGNGPLLGQLSLLVTLGTFTVVGLLIATRRPGNRIGMILLAAGACWAFLFLSNSYTTFAFTVGRLPGATWILAATQGLWVPAIGFLAVYAILLFPDGHLPSPGWRWVARIAGIAIVGFWLGLTIAPGPIQTNGAPPQIDNPFGLDGLGPMLVVLELLLPVLLVCVIATVASMIGRLRRASGEEREQLRWLAYAVSILAIMWIGTVVLSITLEDAQNVVPPWLGVLQNLVLYVFALIPISIGFAVLRYRLYDIDVVISKTIVFGALAAFITIVYVLVVVGLGALLGSSRSLALSIGATALIAVLFEPVHERVRRVANRFVYGERATPYEVMAGFSARVADTVSINEAMPRMASVAGEGVGASEVVVRVFLPEGLERAERWLGAEDHGGEPERFPVAYQGESIGELDVRKPMNEPLSAAERGLLTDLAGQAGLAMHNVRLTEELAIRLRELDEQSAALRASRERLVTARDVQRRGLQRDLHEGPERRLGEMIEAVGRAERAKDLDALMDRANETLEGLRDLARGIFPPLLADQGIEAALEAHIRKVGANATVEADPATAGARFDADTEACVYFCCLQAIQNVIRHAANARCIVRLAADGDALTFEIADDGPGFDPASTSRGMGLDIMQDRVDALEGDLTVRSAIGSGTTIAVRIPVREVAST